MAKPINARRAGHAYERDLVNQFKELGFNAHTSRYANRMLDDAGVDLVGTDPFSIQAKRWKSAPSYHEVLAKMPKDSNYNVIFHKRPNKGEVVVMEKADFMELVEMLINEGVIKL